MREPSPRTSRLAIAGSLVALLAIGGGGFLLGRRTVPPPAPPAMPATPTPTPRKIVVADEPAERALSRADLIALGNAAADATASGVAFTGPLAQAAGRRFELHLPFGCDGSAPAGSEAALRWRYDPAAPALRVHVAPVTWPVAEWWNTPPADLEALEGFWIARPWSSRETCATGGSVSAAPGAEPITLPGQTLGVAQLITAETPRQLRRGGKPYRAVVRVEPDAVRLDAGLRIRLAGRIGRFPDGEVARCTQPAGREQRPVCLVAVTLDEVAIENPATQQTISIWTPTAARSAESATQ